MMFVLALVFALGWYPEMTSMSVLGQHRKEFELTREQTTEMLRVLKSDRDRTGYSPKFAQLLEDTLSKDKLELLKAYTFQERITGGSLPKLLRIMGVKHDEKAVTEEQRKRAIAIAEQIPSDSVNLGVLALDEVIDSRELRQRMGEDLKIVSFSLSDINSIEAFEDVDVVPLQILRAKEVADELELSKLQKAAIEKLLKDLVTLKTIAVGDLKGGFGNAEIDEDRKITNEIYEQSLAFLTKEQLPRYKEILLQVYVKASPMLAAVHLKRLGLDIDLRNKRLQDRHQSHRILVNHCRKCRTVASFSEMLEPIVGEKLFRHLMHARKSQAIVYGKTIPYLQKLESPDRVPTKNPRRSNK